MVGNLILIVLPTGSSELLIYIKAELFALSNF